jgi:hypothetical protein
MPFFLNNNCVIINCEVDDWIECTRSFHFENKSYTEIKKIILTSIIFTNTKHLERILSQENLLFIRDLIRLNVKLLDNPGDTEKSSSSSILQPSE